MEHRNGPLLDQIFPTTLAKVASPRAIPAAERPTGGLAKVPRGELAGGPDRRGDGGEAPWRRAERTLLGNLQDLPEIPDNAGGQSKVSC